MNLVYLLFNLSILSLLIPSAFQRQCNQSRLFKDGCLAKNLCAEELASDLNKPRGLAIHDNQLFLVSSINHDILSMPIPEPDEEAQKPVVIVNGKGLNHGIAVTDTHIFASSQSDVYRYTRDPNNPYAEITGTEIHIINNIPSEHHVTRTLLIIGEDLYVQVGSGSNIDDTSYRSQVRLFKGLASKDFNFSGLNDFYASSELAFDGLRNEVGIKQDPVYGDIYGVENGVDNVQRYDLLDEDIHNENPCEELNKLTLGFKGGYPFCFSNGLKSKLPGKPGDQYADLRPPNPKDDAWCQDEANVDRPFHCMEPHTAPLGLTFTKLGKDSSLDNQIVVANHGSWNRNPPTGYNLVLNRFTQDRTGIESSQRIFYNCGESEKWESGLRPVDVVTGAEGQLIFTDDGSQRLFLIRQIDETKGIDYVATSQSDATNGQFLDNQDPEIIYYTQNQDHEYEQAVADYENSHSSSNLLRFTWVALVLGLVGLLMY